MIRQKTIYWLIFLIYSDNSPLTLDVKATAIGGFWAIEWIYKWREHILPLPDRAIYLQVIKATKHHFMIILL